MRDELLDLITHTQTLGCIELIKITGTEDETTVDGVAEDRSVVLQAKFREPIPEFKGRFGMPNMTTLKTILGLEVYSEDAKITVNNDKKKGPVSLKFENAEGDFKNEYRFMVRDVVDDLFKTVKFKGVNWNVTFEPDIVAIKRLKFQRAVSTESSFTMKTNNGNLECFFGDPSSHAGNFVFAHDVEGEVKQSWHWPADRIISILELDGDKVFQVSDDGASQIIVDSGLAEYTYILPALSK